MRLFVAVEISDDIKNYLGKIQEEFIDNHSNKIGLVNVNNIHLTLKFLGEVQPNNVEIVKKDLKKITFNKFSVYLDKIGVFPSENCIRVVWVGLKPEDPILGLQKDIDDRLKKLFKKEKNFKAHITLARVKFIEDKKQFINELKKIKVENKNIKVDSFKLVKSSLTGQGPIYEDIDIFSGDTPE
ncbi:MAG: RNA 2',3'-cyclic phosphodiesterase [Nanoarchaeota archaeon]|nr:RNA 2',3'-cyclic phosphodiesterase [Nanoarchaeota archaeon]